MMKKTLIFLFVLAAAVSPFLPRVMADNAAWKTLLADRVWNQPTFKVDRLVTSALVSEPMKRNGVAFVSAPAADCADPGLCTKIDLSILRGGTVQTVSGVDQSFLNPTFAMAQKGKFVFTKKSSDAQTWFDAFFMDPNTGEIYPFGRLTKKTNELNVTAFSTSADRLYASILQKNPQTNQVQTLLMGQSVDGTYEQRNIAFTSSAPRQQVMDAYNDQLLVKFEFSGGAKELWLINSKTQQMTLIPETWTESPGDIVYARFLSDGSVTYFQNYRLRTYKPGPGALPQLHASATLNWERSIQSSVQFEGDVMAFTDVNNTPYIVSLSGVDTVPLVIKPESLRVIAGSAYFTDTENNFWRFSPAGDQAYRMPIGVTDVKGSKMVGVDAVGDIWLYEDQKIQGTKLGFGANPVFTDDTHIVWKGTDGMLYQATMAGITTFQPVPGKMVEGYVPGTRLKAIGNPRVYMIGNDGQLHWIVSEDAASDVFGPLWNQGIVEVESTFLWRFGTGADITSAETLRSV